MIFLLKIILSIITVALCYTAYFVINEYKKFRKSNEVTSYSLMEKFVMGALAFSSVVLSIGFSIFFILVIISQVTIILPTFSF